MEWNGDTSRWVTLYHLITARRTSSHPIIKLPKWRRSNPVPLQTWQAIKSVAFGLIAEAMTQDQLIVKRLKILLGDFFREKVG